MTSISRLTTCAIRDDTSAMVMSCLTRYACPYSSRWLRPVRYSTASRRVFDGMVPVLMQTPPIMLPRSTIAAR